MRLYRQALLSLALTAFLLQGAVLPGRTAPPVSAKATLKPDVAALIKLSTDAYKKMKSYRHSVTLVGDEMDEAGVLRKRVHHFTLALDRPNRFVYKDDTQPMAAAVSDGKTFINLKGDALSNLLQYTSKSAPADFKGINIVDDVTFEPIGTYVIALMLQGDSLADKDVRAALEKATLKPGIVTENGKKWQVIAMPFGPQEDAEIYFNAADHLIGKTVVTAKVDPRISPTGIKIVETIENVSVDKPIEASVFQYTPPANAKKIDKFLPPQRPDDARNMPHHGSATALTRLAASR